MVGGGRGRVQQGGLDLVGTRRVSADGSVSGIVARPVAVVGSGMTVGFGTVSASSEVVSSTEYDSSRCEAAEAHHGSNVASTVGVVPEAK